RQALGNDRVLTDEASRTLYSTDVFRALQRPVAVIQPGTKAELALAVGVATRAGLSVVPRGGGMSYTDGYLPDRAESVVVDTRRLDRIVEINTQDMFVTAEAGVTWRQLNEALAPRGVRTPFWGTGSGLYATVGGSLSQGAMNLGSSRYGISAESVLGLEIVLADGRLLKTGSGATPYNPSPFFRTYGPDLTGPFLGDAGALGIKAQATLKLIPRPAEIDFASFEFGTQSELVAALTGIARSGVASECTGYDPRFLRQRIKRQSLAADVQMLAQVAAGGRSVMQGLKDATRIVAAGRKFLEQAAFTMHVTVEGRDGAEVKSGMAAVRELARTGREIEASVPRIARGRLFPPPTLLVNNEGELWVPVHCIVPHSRLATTLDAIERYFADHVSLVEEFQIDWGNVVFACGTQAALIEPSFFYRDALNPLHEHLLDQTVLGGVPRFSADVRSRAAITRVRENLAELFLTLGAVHMQIGKFYRYREGREPETWQLLSALKRHLDPKGLMNPGALGLS
ncbi:MAG: FAD-binding oxidoreductase, partial [Acidimicrobiia bacterium]|nr:FAD-binding oxidoreductase [Acidimicrobiia bacterium]